MDMFYARQVTGDRDFGQNMSGVLGVLWPVLAIHGFVCRGNALPP